MAIRALLFDLDDTLIDTTGTHSLRAERIGQTLARHLKRFDLNDFVQRVLQKDPVTGWRLGVVPLLKELDILETELGTEVLEMWFFRGCEDLVRSFPGASEALDCLRGEYLLGVVTNGRDARQRLKFESLPFHRYFNGFLTSEQAGVEKPAVEIFHMAASELGVGAEEVAVIGDRLDVDVLGAKQAGMFSIWLDHQGRYPPGIGPDPDARIVSFGQLPSLLESMHGIGSDAAPGDTTVSAVPQLELGSDSRLNS